MIYRAHILDEAGKVLSSFTIVAETDEEAARKAGVELKANDISLWEGTRIVTFLKASR